MTHIRNAAPAARRSASPVRRRVAFGAVAAATLAASLAMPLSTAWAAQQDTAAASSGRAADSRKAALQRNLDDVVRKDGVVGAQAALVDGKHRVSVRSGTAELGTDKAVPHNGYFRMGSNTKTFVATVLLQLESEGRLRLSDTVDHWLPGLIEGNGNDGKRITVRQLLQHTSGLPDYAARLPGISDEKKFQKHRFDSYQPRDLVELALRDEPTFEPGKGWSYSNTGYVVAGMIIEKATGRTWSDEVRSRIIEPLGLKHTFAAGDERLGLPEPHAKSYMQFKAGGPLVESTEVNMTWGDAAGSLVTTSKDLTRFWQKLLGGQLLGPKQLKQMRTTVPIVVDGQDTGERAGLGVLWRPLSCGGGYWGHGGTTLGHLNANGFVGKGERGVIAMRSTNLAAEDRDVRTDKLVDDALCRRK
ncbi:serine hydrolase domain-containing protein [Streptomyces sp. NPDC087300]|uniref:serine hydrolase domain-containing protein n=1 Tax=Streptomyces sp. NPDC087300 TaxID=3365780 RepID=UPI00382E9B81